MLKRWQREVEKDVLPVCSVSENCFHALASDNHVILASSKSRKLFVLKDGELVRVAELQECVRSMLRVSLVGPAGEDCFFIVCATSTGGIWIIPERKLLQRCQDDGLDGHKRWRSSPPPRGPSGKRARTDGSLASQQAALGAASTADVSVGSGPPRDKQEPALAEDNAGVFASLLCDASTSAAEPRPVPLAELSSFWEEGEADVQRRVAVKHRAATVGGAAALVFAAGRLTVVSLPAASEMALDTFQLTAADPTRGEAVTVHRTQRVSRPTHSPGSVTRALLISRRADDDASSTMAGSFIDYATSPRFATSCLLLALDDGCVYCQSPDRESPTQERPLLRCRAPVLAILPVSVGADRAADGPNGIVAVDESGYVVLFVVLACRGRAAVVARRSALRPVTRCASVAGPLAACCLLQCPSGNGTELVAVLACAGDAGVTFARLPSLARLADAGAAAEPFECRTVPLANVCGVWPAAAPGVCMCRGRLGTVTRVACPSFSAAASSPRPAVAGSALRVHTLQDALSKLRAVSETIEHLEADDRWRDDALLSVSQGLHLFGAVRATADRPQSAAAPAPLGIAVTPVVGAHGPGVDAAHLRCCVRNGTELVPSAAYCLQVSVVYSSPTCQHSTSWSLAVPLAHLAAGGVRTFRVPLLPRHVACCTVSLAVYLALDVGALLSDFPAAAAAAAAALPPAACGSCVELVHSEQLDVLSFCRSQATADAALALDCQPPQQQQQPLLPLQMMSDIADRHRSDAPRASRALPLPAAGKDEPVSKLHSLSVHVPLPPAVVRDVLCDLLGVVAVSAGQRYALAVPRLAKCWIELKQQQPQQPQQQQQQQSRADNATSPPATVAREDRCPVCAGATGSDHDLECVLLWSCDRDLLASLHRALLLRFQARAEQDHCHACSSLAPQQLRAHVDELGSQVQSLRDQFIDLQALIEDTARNKRIPAAGSAISRPLSEQLARFREGMWQAYSNLLSVPVALCTL